MRVLLLFFFIISININENEGKYIDSLSEKEKDKFLDQIARRILEEVQTGNESIRKSGEISDAQLEKYDAFVRKILDEESRNLSKHDSKIVNIIPRNKRQQNKDGHIDLNLDTDHKHDTTRPGRKIFEGFAADESSKDEINKGQANEQSDLDIHVKNFDKDEVYDKGQVFDKEEDNFDKYDPPSHHVKISTIEPSDYIEKNFQIHENGKSNKETSTSTPNGDEISTSDVNIITSTKQVSFDTENSTNVVKYEIDSSKYVEEKFAFSNVSNMEQVINITEPLSAAYESHNSRSYDFRNDNSTTIPDLRSTNDENNFDDSKVDNLEKERLNTTTTEDVEIESTTDGYTRSDSPITLMSTSEKPNMSFIFTTEYNVNIKLTTTETSGPEISHVTTTPRSKITTINMDSKERASALPTVYRADHNSKENSPFLNDNNTKSNDSIVQIGITKSDKNENDVEKLLSNILNVLKANFLGKTNQTVETENLIPPDETADSREYRVYEIPANRPPFSKESLKLKESKLDTKAQAYFVPIYGYSTRKTAKSDNSDREIYYQDDEDIFKNRETPIAWDYFFANDYTRKIKSNNKSILKQHPGNVVKVDNYTVLSINRDDYQDLSNYYKNSVRSSGTDVEGNRNNYLHESKISGENFEEIQSEKEICDNKIKFVNNFSNIRHLIKDLKNPYKKKEKVKIPKTIFIDMRNKQAKQVKNNVENLQPKQTRIPKYIYIFSRQNRSETSKNEPKDVSALLKILARLNKVKRIETSTHTDNIMTKTVEEDNNLKNKQNIDKNISEEINIYLNIIEDKIRENDKALIQFDWLGSTVDLQSALMKMNEMLSTIHYQEIQPPDLELLKYLIHIHKTANRELDGIAKMSGRKSILPKGKNKKGRHITAKGITYYNHARLLRREKLEIADEDLREFQLFLDDLESALYDLHTTIKYISMVTTHQHQNWFKNLKELQKFHRKQSAELLVHIIASRILGLIEKSARNGLVNDHSDYMMNNLEDVEMTEKDFLFLLKLLRELKYYN